MRAETRVVMHADFKDALALWVPCDACRTIRAAQGGVVMALEGRVWMTVEGDTEDYWLEPGEALPLAPGERARISGWREGVRFEVRCEGELLAQPREWRFARLRAWLQVRLTRRAPRRLAGARDRAPQERVA
ncbi:MULTISPECIES: DUF2917 domain-containing protein [unclassified Paraburkholderia]|uniref:DUF2917 domain-containing protein n=1 Tax=unclassified Paraburkholderia TaxID=2615204 RepID=UPI002AB64A87|nr:MULTISPECIES: DUF2917 domain-containing protein [unclassified Paraburkholderia]